ncbi:MAG: hypothetical protein QXJ17_03690 [Nitrososphaeria archaeon]
MSLNIEALYEYLLNEILNADLTKIDESLYENIALYFKNTRNGGNQTNTINNVLLSEERFLVISLIRRLVELRFKKILLDPQRKLSLSNLTAEETYLYESFKRTCILMDRFLKNIEMGNINALQEVKKKVIKRAVLVKIHSEIPPFMGVDLQKYGPFEPEDVTIIPYTNIEPFLNKLSVSEGWVELS